MSLDNLDPSYPIIFFPIRIETKYANSANGGRKLRLRFYPDQISINNFDPRLTRKEVKDARDYWRAIIDNGTSHRDSAWIKLANQYGLPRAAYITKAVINYDPDSQADPVTPSFKTDAEIPQREEDDNLVARCSLLPSRFRVYGKFNDPALKVIHGRGERIPELLQIDPFQNIDSEAGKWVTDFKVALEKGMAIELSLTEQQYNSGFKYIIAYGVRDRKAHTPERTKQEIENLFTAHRYNTGLRLLKQGTPTNLVKERPKERDGQAFFSPHHPSHSDAITYRSVEFEALDKEQQGQIVLHKSDGRILERLLGLDNIADGLLNANNNDQLTAACMSSALWPAVLGYFMDRFANIEGLNVRSFQNHFVKYVSAQGRVPPICVGKTPYGILPVTILSNWEDKELLAGTDHIRSFFVGLKNRWRRFVENVPTVMRNDDDSNSNSNGDPSSENNLINILSMEAVSHTYNVRGFRSINYISDFIHEILQKPTQSSEDLVVKNELLLNILLKLTFEFIPDGALKGLYDITPGRGISQIDFRMVSPQKEGEEEDEEEVDDSPPEYIEKMYNDIKGTDRNFLKTTKDQMKITGIGPSDFDPLLLRLLRYSASLLGKKDDQEEIEKFVESLEILRNLKPDRLKTLMLQTLDLVSYRLDAWICSFANQRLDHLRETKEKGLYAGAFGWIENLMPRAESQTSEGGYIQAPSYVHAAASAVLRNGYLIHANDREKKDLFKINLNSERTKDALELINGIQNTPLPELLGYKLERRLHDTKIDYLIDEFRKHFPLNKDDLKKLEHAIEQRQERIVPRNVTDGLAVFKNWKRLVDSISSFDAGEIKEFMKRDSHVPGWQAFFIEISKKYAADQEEKILNLINQLKPELNFLLDKMDGLSDLCIAESVFQAVGGNFSRSGAVLDGMSGDGQIPTPEISMTPRTGPRQTQRIALAFEVEPLENLILRGTDNNIPWTSPRKLAEPNVNDLLKTYIGDVSFWIDFKDESGTVTTTKELSLKELDLEAIDLLYIENSELDARLHYFAKSRGFTNYYIRYEQKDLAPEQIEKRSLVDLQFLIKALRQTMIQGRPFGISDLIPPNQSIQNELLLHTVREIFQRYYDLILLLLQTLDELRSAKSDVTEAGIVKKRLALIKAGFFASEFAVPVSPEGNILESQEELDRKIDVAMKELTSRLPHQDDQGGKLLQWKSMLEREGEAAFLESIVNELSGEPQNKRKYLKTIDLLIEQMRKILNINSFLIASPFTISSDTKLKTSSEINSKVSKWIQKTSYVRPQMKLLDEIITYNQIFASSYFTYFCDEGKFMQSAEILEKQKEHVNPVSLVLVISIKAGEQDNTNFPRNLAAIVTDEWTDKIVSKEQDTHIAYHYNAPNAEAPQCLLLAVSPNDQHKWDRESIRRVILDTLELAKLRAVDYRSVKDLRHFLPTVLLNSHGEDIFINLFNEDFR